MRRTRSMLVAAALCAALTPQSARGAGYSIYEQGAAALGMAGAVTASVLDPSAVFFNPAAMTRLEGTRVSVGGTAITPITSFSGASPYPGFGVTEETRRKSVFPPTIYATTGSGSWAAGVGINSPYGLGIEWKRPATFSGRHVATEASLQTLNGSLSVAYALNPGLSLAIGEDALFASVDLKRRVLVPAPGGGGATVDVAETELKSDFTPGYGWNAALSWAPSASTRLGAYYRSKVIVHVENGTADFRQIPTGNAAFDAGVAATLPPDQPVKTVLRFPAIWSAGAAWLPGNAWTIEADFNFFEWSLFRDLPIYFQTTPAANETVVEDYDDSWQVRVGIERRLQLYSYRAGYYFDKAAAPPESVTPLLPDADRHGATLGFGWKLGERWVLDLYDLALFFKQRSTEAVNRDGFDGEYKTFVNATGLGVTYRW